MVMHKAWDCVLGPNTESLESKHMGARSVKGLGRPRNSDLMISKSGLLAPRALPPLGVVPSDDPKACEQPAQNSYSRKTNESLLPKEGILKHLFHADGPVFDFPATECHSGKPQSPGTSHNRHSCATKLRLWMCDECLSGSCPNPVIFFTSRLSL